MAWNPQRKVYVSVLALAGAALIVDRFFLGASSVSGPAPAAASQEFAVPQRTAAEKIQQPTKDEPIAGDLAARLEALRQPGDTGDLFYCGFAPPRAQLDAPAPVEAAPAFDTEAFIASHPLSAVMRGNGGSLAVIGKRVLRVGDTLDGLTLVRIENQSAVFEGAGTPVVITVGRADPR